MPLTQHIEEIEKKFEKDFEFLYGSEDPTRTFHDHDDYLIIKENFKNILRQSILSTLQAVRKQLPEEETLDDNPYSDGYTDGWNAYRNEVLALLSVNDKDDA